MHAYFYPSLYTRYCVHLPYSTPLSRFFAFISSNYHSQSFKIISPSTFLFSITKPPLLSCSFLYISIRVSIRVFKKPLGEISSSPSSPCFRVFRNHPNLFNRFLFASCILSYSAIYLCLGSLVGTLSIPKPILCPSSIHSSQFNAHQFSSYHSIPCRFNVISISTIDLSSEKKPRPPCFALFNLCIRLLLLPQPLFKYPLTTSCSAPSRTTPMLKRRMHRSKKKRLHPTLKAIRYVHLTMYQPSN